MSHPTLAVILPAHNEAKHIGRQLEAILSQSRLPDNLVLLDDGSTDDTYKEMLAVKVQHGHRLAIDIIHYQRSVGCCEAYAHASQHADTDWLYLASANDVVQLGAFEAWEQAVLLYRGMQLVCGCPVGHELGWKDAGTFFGPRTFISKLRHQHIHGCATFIRRDVWEQYGGFREELGSLADFWLFHLVALRHGLVYVPQAIAKVGTKPSCHEDMRSREKRQTIVERIKALLALPENADVRDGFENTILARVMRGEV